MADKKAITLEQLGIAKNYIDAKDAECIKSAEFVDNAIKLYTSEDKSGEAVAELILPEETFLDGSKTELVSNFAWDITKYPKSTDPNLDGKSVLVLAVRSARTVRYSFISLDYIVSKLTGGATDSANISVNNDVVSLSVKVSELSGNRIVIKDDGLYVGEADTTPAWVVSTDDEVAEMFSVSSSGITLTSMNVGDTVKIRENGELVDYLIVHKGLPSDMYDKSCDGVWVLRKYLIDEPTRWDGTDRNDSFNDYENSDVNERLNGEFLDKFDLKTRSLIKNVKIPYRPGDGTSDIVLDKENGMITKIFLLSYREVGLPISYDSVALDGAKLDYFDDDDSRIAMRSNNSSRRWWLRTPTIVYSSAPGTNNKRVWAVGSDGNAKDSYIYDPYMPENKHDRPAFILPYNIKVDSDGIVTG